MVAQAALSFEPAFPLLSLYVCAVPALYMFFEESREYGFVAFAFNVKTYFQIMDRDHDIKGSLVVRAVRW